jgi:chromosomal replication initiator protein
MTLESSLLTRWRHCLQRLEQELSAQDFNTWIRPLHAEEADQTLCLLAPNRFVVEWLKKHFFQRIIELLTHFNQGNKPKVVLQVGTRKIKATQSLEKTPEKPVSSKNTYVRPSNTIIVNESPLNPDFTFNNFVAGTSNQMAHSAALHSAEKGGFNPLFIYGGVGLGKTHLMHAVGNSLLSHKPNSRVLYLHAERFVADMIKALQNKNLDDFKNYYRSVDILLIDDIQFLAGKTRSQEEFYHTFNTLMDGRQQLILTCDRTPQSIMGLEDRLKSRLSSGLTVNIEPPELETRVAILQTKAHRAKLTLPDEAALYIAEHVVSNIRELEGALHRLIAGTQFMRRPISLEFCHDVLKDLIVTAPRVVTIENILQTVAFYYKISLEEMLSKRRHRYLVRPRQLAMFLCKELTRHSIPAIAQAFARDRTTVLHSCKAITELKITDKQVYQDYLNLLSALSGT